MRMPVCAFELLDRAKRQLPEGATTAEILEKAEEILRLASRATEKISGTS